MRQGTAALAWNLGLNALLLGLLAAAAVACDCDMPPAPKVAMQQAQAVFTGKVLNIKVTPAGDYPKTVQFQVENAWKGVTEPKVTVQTERGFSGDCGFLFSQGKRYLIYAYTLKGQPHLITNICSRTRLLADAHEDLAALGPRVSPPVKSKQSEKSKRITQRK